AGTASVAVERFVAVQSLRAGARARFLLADGDRLLAAGAIARAAARYEAAARLVPDSSEGQRARVRAVRATAASAAGPADLAVAHDALGRLTRSGLGGEAAQDARVLQSLLQRVAGAEDGSEGDRFRAAELARDSLGAPRLAAALFLSFARGQPGSLFAPKAIVAALALDPAAADSLLPVLDAVYPTSPYTRARHGGVRAGTSRRDRPRCARRCRHQSSHPRAASRPSGTARRRVSRRHAQRRRARQLRSGSRRDARAAPAGRASAARAHPRQRGG